MAFQAGELFATLSLDVSSLEKGLAGAEKQILGLGKTLGGLGLTAMLTRPLAEAGKEIVTFGSAFEAEMDRVGAILNLEGLGLSVDEAARAMENLRETALKMGETTSLSASQAAQAMEALAMAGWRTDAIEAAIEPLIRLTEVSGSGSLEEAAGIVADTLTALGAEASEAGRLSDVLTAAATGSNTDLSKLGSTFKYVASMAGTLGFSMEDLALASGLLANAGVKAQKAGTGLRAMLNHMSSNQKAKAAMEELGLSLYDETGAARSLRDVMTDLRAAFAGLTEEERTQTAYLLAGTSGMNAVLAIAGATEDAFTSLASAIDASSGLATRTASKMLDNLQGDLTLLDSALGTTKILLAGTAETIGRGAVRKLTELLQQFNALGSGGQSAVMKLGAFAAALGPVLTGLGLIETAAASLGPAVLGLVSPMGLLTGGVLALGAAAFSSQGDLGDLLTTLSGRAGTLLESLESGLKGAFARLRAELPSLLGGLIGGIRNVLPRLLSLLSQTAALAMQTMAERMGEMTEVPRAILKSLAQGLTAHASELVHAGVTLMSSLLAGSVSALPDLVALGAETASAFLSALMTAPWDTAGIRIGEAIRGCLGDLSDLGGRLMADLGGRMAHTLTSDLSAGLKGLGSALSGAFRTLGDALGSEDFGALLRGLANLAGDVTQALEETLREGIRAAGDVMTSALLALGQLPAGEIVRALSDWAGRIVAALSDVLRQGVLAAVNLTEAFSEACRRIDWADLGRALSDLAQDLLRHLGDALTQLDLSGLIQGLCAGIAAAANGLTEAAGVLIGRLVQSLTDPAQLSALADTGLKLVRSLLEGILGGISRLGEAVINGIGNLLGPALAGLFGETFDTQTKTIDVFRNTRFQVDPALFGSAEKTGRELENLLSSLLLGGIGKTEDLRRVTAIYDTLSQSGQGAVISLMEGLSAFGETGLREVYGDLLTALSTGQDLEQAGQKAALLYMTGFGALLEGSIGAATDTELASRLYDAMRSVLGDGRWMDAEGLIDVQALASDLSLSLSSVLGFAIPEGYRLAFDGAQGVLQRVTEEGFETLARGASFQSLFDGEALWDHVERTTFSGLGDLAGEMAQTLQSAGLTAGDLLGRTLGEETQRAMAQALSDGDTYGALAQALAGLGLQSAGEEMAEQLLSETQAVKQAADSVADAADPGPQMTELFEQAGTQAVQAATGALEAAQPEMRSAMESFSSEAVEAFAMTMTAEEGEKLASGFARGAADGLRGNASGLSQAARTLGASAVSALSATLSVSYAVTLGQRFASGLAQGLRSGAASVASAAAALSGGATGTVKSAWAIHSPSRVARTLGEQYVEGLALGLGETGQVRAMAAQLSACLTDVGKGASPSDVWSKETELTAGAQTGTQDAQTRERTDAQRDERLCELLAAALSGVEVRMDGRAVGTLVAPTVSQMLADGARSRRFTA